MIYRSIALLAMLTGLSACERAEQPDSQAALVVLSFQEASGATISRQIRGASSLIPMGGVSTSLVLSRYDADHGQIGRANFGEVTLATTSNVGPVNDTVGKSIRPGRYAIVRFVQAGRWGACFHNHTWQFDVAPGEVVYLGTLDAKFHAASLAAAIKAAGKETLQGSGEGGEHYVAYDDVPSPRLRPARDVKTVAAFVAAEFPAFSGLPHNVVLTPARFSTSGTIATLGTRTCGVMGG